ncbi:MAG: OmpP1/FadL family transporter [Candidatus Aminicenantales bacterium]
MNWRGGFKVEFDGDLALDSPVVQIPPPFDQLVPPGTIEAVIPREGNAATAFNFPHVLGVGVAFSPTDRLLISADFHYILWETYDKFTVDIDVPLPIPGVEFEDKLVEENWENSWLIRGGFEVMVTDSLALRGGAFYDKTPQPVETMDPILPDADRVGITAGLGYKSGNFVLNVAYQFEPFMERTSPNRRLEPYQLPGGINLGEGTYSTTAHLFGISLGYIF